MVSGGDGCFLRILPIVDPPAALESVALGAAAHELPHAACASTGNSQRMKTGLCLRQIDEFWRNSLLPKNAMDHVFIAAGASQTAFQGTPSAVREVVDVASDLIGHHQRQVGTC